MTQQSSERAKDCGRNMKRDRLNSSLVISALQATGRILDAILNLRGEADGHDLMCVSHVSGQWYALNKHLLAIKRKRTQRKKPLD